MHDAIGIAGMLRGWVAMWTVQMVWPLLALAASLCVTAIAEALMEARGQRKHHGLPLAGASASAPCQNPPPG